MVGHARYGLLGQRARIIVLNHAALRKINRASGDGQGHFSGAVVKYSEVVHHRHQVLRHELLAVSRECFVQGSQRSVLQEDNDEKRNDYSQPADGKRATFQKRPDFGDERPFHCLWRSIHKITWVCAVSFATFYNSLSSAEFRFRDRSFPEAHTPSPQGSLQRPT